MKAGKTFPLIALAILIFVVWLSRDLLNAWQHSPRDRLGWLALVMWLTPLLIKCRGGRARGELAANPFLLGAAIFAGSFSELTELHFFGHLALALAVAAWLKVSWRSIAWFVAAAAWMPVFGWWLANFPDGTVG